MARHANRTPSRETQPRTQDATTSPRDAAAPATATIIATDAADGTYPNEVTIVGRGTPSSFEITVDGTIDPDAFTDDDATDATLVSGTTVEGTIDTGTITFGFDGELADVTFVDRTITGSAPGAVPTVHVDYGSE